MAEYPLCYLFQLLLHYSKLFFLSVMRKQEVTCQ